MDSDSSSSDCAEMLKEAVDCSLFDNSMFQDKLKEATKTEKRGNINFRISSSSIISVDFHSSHCQV